LINNTGGRLTRPFFVCAHSSIGGTVAAAAAALLHFQGGSRERVAAEMA